MEVTETFSLCTTRTINSRLLHADLASFVDQTELLEIGNLSYQIERKLSCQVALSMTNAVEMEMCSKEYFSSPVKGELFPANVIDLRELVSFRASPIKYRSHARRSR